MYGNIYTIVCIYAPNIESERIDFFKRTGTWVKQLSKNDTNIILSRDFNCCLNDDDRHPATHLRDKSRKTLINIVNSLKLEDVWKRKPGYTFHDGRTGTKSRLDYIFISNNSDLLCKNSKILNAIKCDHKSVIGKCEIKGNTRGKGYWKLNSEILQDQKYCQGVKMIIENAAENLPNIESKRMKWELLKNNVKQFTIQACVQRARKQRELRIRLQNDIDNINTLLNENWDEDRARIKVELEDAQQTLYSEKSKGAYIRSRITWLEKGEKSMSYFLRMEKSRQANNTIKSLKKDNGDIVSEDIEILEVAKSFYEKLYTSKEVDSQQINEYLNGLQTPKLNPDDKQNLEVIITPNELDEVINNLKMNKSPGLDGLTTEFYKQFWTKLKPHFLEMMNKTFALGELPPSSKKAVLSLIFKKNDRQLMKNYRPLSLMNCDFKIIAFALANRLKPVLHKLINLNQSGYIKGRFIGNSIRIIKDIYEWSENFDKDGAIICCDFEKAFDSLEWNFMYSVLKKINFGENFLKWVNIFYADPTLVIKNNGWLSTTVKIKRGIRQGCPISALIFILCVEIMAIKLRHAENIQGFTFQNKEFKVTQYADDTTITVRTLDSILEAINIIFEFGSLSGLTLNKDKCEGILLGGLKNTIKDCHGINFTNKPVKCLGIYIGHDHIKCNELNWLPKLKKLESSIETWKSRNLTIFGKVLIIKSLFISQLVYNMTILEVDDNIIKSLNTLLYNFLWKGTDRIKRNTMIGQIQDGGISMIDVESKVLSLKASWVKRLLDNECEHIFIINTYLEKMGIDFKYLLKGYFTSIKHVAMLKIPMFYKMILVAFHKCKAPVNMKCTNIFLSQPLWCNINICGGNITLLYKNWAKDGILYVSDCINKDNKMLNEQQLLTKLNNRTNWIAEYMSIRNHVNIIITNADVSSAMYMTNNEIYHGTLVAKNATYNIISLNAKTCYYLLVRNKFVKPIAITKWQRDFNILLLEMEWRDIYVCKIINIPDTRVAQFNFKMLNNIVVSKDNLFKWKKVNDNRCSYCGLIENTKHIYFDCINVLQMWENIGKILKTKITWKDIVLGVRGDNLIVLFRNFLYSIILYALFKNWCKNMDNKIFFDGNVKTIEWKYIIFNEMKRWELILRNTSHSVRKILRLWTNFVHKISYEY